MNGLGAAMSHGDNGSETSTVIPMAEPKQREEDQPEPSSDIDWANVASEVNTMLELNKAANETWAEQRGEEDGQEREQKA